jgi:hypothetical protein
MKNIPAVKTLIENDYAVRALPEVIVDWNMNRYIDVVADNTPHAVDAAYDDELFPIESIAEPLRPTKGINKARIGSSTISDDYLSEDSLHAHARFYIADIDDLYKYWTSPDASDASTGALANCKPQVVYGESVTVNKIVVTLENTWASPSTFSIQTTTATAPGDGDWTEIANQTNTPAGWKGIGQIVLYWNGSSWRNTARTNGVTTNIRGVRLVVTALEGGYKVTDDGSAVASTYVITDNGAYQQYNTTGKDARFDLIEISARLEIDLSENVISVSDQFDTGESDELHPIGTTTTNQGTITLSNIYYSAAAHENVVGLFSAKNTESPYHKFIDANGEFTIRYNYYKNDVLVGTVQQAKMYSNNWSGQSDETVQVSLSDYSKFFNEIKVRAALWEDLTVPKLVWRILDSIGFVNYVIPRDSEVVTEHKIPIFYADGETNAWELLDSLAQASQTAIYFDAYGRLQIRTREFAFSPDAAPVWTFNSHKSGTKLEDIINLNETEEFEPNHYTVNYQKTDWAPMVNDSPTLQKVWEPEGNIVLRGTPLDRTLGVGDAQFYVSQKEVRLWPFSGMVNIDAEIIKYEGKEYVYYTGPSGDVKNTKFITSLDEEKAKDDSTPWRYAYKNHYTGGLKITERAAWNSEQLEHSVDATGYSTRSVINGNHNADANGFHHLKGQSKVELDATRNMTDYKDILVSTHGSSNDTSFYYYGTKFMFKGGPIAQYAGLVINNSGNDEDGYYFEFTNSANITGSSTRKSFIVYSRINGNDKRLASQNLAIGRNIEYELDIGFSINGDGSHKLIVWVNGKQIIATNVSGADRNAANGKFGMFVRANTRAHFEYLYGIKKAGIDIPDDFSFMDKVRRSYVGDLWSKEWVFVRKTKKRRHKKHTNIIKYKVNERFMDDFGPYVHEIREFDVKFDPSPVLHSRLYLTNDWSATVLDYNADPFGAKFTMANTYRNNAVIQGDDTLSYAGSGASINQILTVFGRALIVDDSQTVIAKNDAQIRRRGKIESDLDSSWVQSEAMAQEVADWLNDNFSYGNKNVSLGVFGNPLVEVGDVVHVTYPEKHIDDDFFVLGTNNQFDQGLSTTLTLRRRDNS